MNNGRLVCIYVDINLTELIENWYTYWWLLDCIISRDLFIRL